YILGYNYKKGYLPARFVQAHPEILVVAPNYRVGVLGSLNLSSLTGSKEYQYSNNLALLDLLEALRWTQENIAFFGGDPERITLYGHSAGSNAISHLMAMPAAEGLFSQTICQSSYMTDLGTVAYDTSEEIGAKFFELAGVHTLEEALALTPEKILDCQQKLFGFHFGGSKASKMFSPVADEIVVEKEPFRHFADGTFNGKRVMIGGSEGEYDQMFRTKDLEETKDFVIQRNQDKKLTRERLEQFVAMHPEMPEKEACMTIHNELGLSLGGEWIGRFCSRFVPVYEYVFRLRDPQEGCRALHGAPSNYVFGTLIPEGAPENMEKQMMDTWAAFIDGGDPNNASIPQWPVYVPDGAVMIMDTEWEVVPGYWEKDFHFWEKDFAEYQYEEALS
ncbi:MAG: carboxylesterase family protein, partial [Clostridiales bacterium]|nr:carboxylesterase family protein [Clostridiales bacterium]